MTDKRAPETFLVSSSSFVIAEIFRFNLSFSFSRASSASVRSIYSENLLPPINVMLSKDRTELRLRAVLYLMTFRCFGLQETNKQ